jgi:hypothetical protein
MGRKIVGGEALRGGDVSGLLSHFVSRWRFASDNNDFPGAPLLRRLLRLRVDVGLSPPDLRERNHDRSHDNKNDDDG